MAPRSHCRRCDTVAVVLERHSGGRIFERTSDGTEHDWGQIAAWEPPHRFAYRWHLAQDPAEATDVEIRFIASESVTRVEIEHSGWERLGDRAENLRDRNQYGWSSLLPHFISSIETSST